MNPRVTVLLPVRNGGAFLREALDSVLRQTLRDLEVLVLDDASTDDSAAIAQAAGDERVRVRPHAQPVGLSRLLNQGLAEARAPFVARMDADDRAEPERLERQVHFLEAHPTVGVCGSWITCFGIGRPFLSRYPCGADIVRAYALFDNPLAHPSVCLRAAVFRAANLRYDEQVAEAQDYDLWVRALAAFDLDNVPEPLLRYRLHAASVTDQRAGTSDARARAIQRAQLARLCIEVTDDELAFHRAVGHGVAMRDAKELARAEAWLQRLVEANRLRSIYPANGMAGAVGFVWLRLCLNSARFRFWASRSYHRSPLAALHAAAWSERAQLWAAGLLSPLRPPRGRPGLRDAVST